MNNVFAFIIIFMVAGLAIFLIKKLIEFIFKFIMFALVIGMIFVGIQSIDFSALKDQVTSFEFTDNNNFDKRSEKLKEKNDFSFDNITDSVEDGKNDVLKFMNEW